MKTIPALTLLSLLTCQLKGQLSYTPATSGLGAVTFEIGYTELEAADMNNDGNIDLITIGDHGSPNFSATEAGAMVFLNNGAGTSWTLKKAGSFGYGGIAAGDVNNDGKMDLGYGMHHNYATGDFGNELIEVALGNGSAQTWTPYDDGLATNGETYGMFGVDFADVNNDGLLDIGANAFGCCAGIHVYKNNGNGTWTQTDGAVGGNSHLWLKFGDFNNDGNTDLMSAWDAGQVWKNDGTGFFSPMQTGIPNYFWIEFDLADVNKDGAKDIGMVDMNGNLKVYTYNKSMNVWQSISSGLPQTGNLLGVALEDMDMDGFVDVVGWKANTITIYKGNGGSSWVQSGSVSITETQLSSLTTGDFDHDGYSDIAYLARANTGDNYLRVYLHAANNPGLDIQAGFPNGFECFAQNSVQFLSWLSSVTPGSTATVKIEFSQSGASGPWNTIAAAAPNSGSYQWTTPAITSGNCYLKYTISDGSSSKTVLTSQAFGVGTCQLSTGVASGMAIPSMQPAVFPNPAAHEASLHFQLGHETVLDITLANALGQSQRIVTGQRFASGFHQVSLPLAGLEAGMYFCTISDGSNSETVKVCIVR